MRVRHEVGLEYWIEQRKLIETELERFIRAARIQLDRHNKGLPERLVGRPSDDDPWWSISSNVAPRDNSTDGSE